MNTNNATKNIFYMCGRTSPYSFVLIMVCMYMFLFIERPWESIRYLKDIPIERPFAVIMIVMAFLDGKFKIIASPINKWVYGLLALHFILAPFAFIPSAAVDQGIDYLKIVILYLLMLAVADDEESLKILIKTYVFSMMFYMMHSLWEYHNGRHVWRMGISRMIGVDSTFSDPNSFGASIVLSLPFVYTLLRIEKISKNRLMYYGYLCLAVFCVVLTGSRSATVAFVLLVLLWALMQQGKRKIVILSVTLITLGAVWIGMPDEKQERIRSIWDDSAGPQNAHSSSDGRKTGFLAGWEMFKRAPLTGIGAGRDNFVEYRRNNLDGIAEQSHNLYAQILGEFGVGGAILFTGLVISIWRCCNRVRTYNHNLEFTETYRFFSGLSMSILASVLLMLILGLAGHNFYRPLWLWLAAWTGSLVGIIGSQERSSKNY